MKLSHVIQAVYFSPWNITEEGWLAVHKIVLPHLDGKSAIPKSESTETDFLGNPLPKMEILPNGVAIIPIIGTLLNHASLLDKQCGAVGYQDIKQNIKKAVEGGAKKIVLNIDSPGGMAQGSHELGDYIDETSSLVPMEAVTDGLMCSAAYDLCCGVNRIACTQTAIVGSIGSMVAMLDESLAYEMQGLKVDLFASGKYKGMGTPGTSLTKDQRELMQATVDKFAGMFKARVQKNRIVEDRTMQGQSFIGSDAVDVGLVDEIIDDIEECFEP
jgi:signal peptide peptidase SppA